MPDGTYQSIDAAPSEWLDAGSNDTSGTLYGGKANPPPPPPPAPPPPEDPSIIRGTDGDDTLQGTTGDNTIYGGKGQDTVVYRGTLDEYELRFDSTHWRFELVDKVSGRDGTDILDQYSIERLQFDGVAVLLDMFGGATLEDGTPLLARYEPPGGWGPPDVAYTVTPGNVDDIGFGDIALCGVTACIDTHFLMADA